jgi:hypothetical protein
MAHLAEGGLTMTGKCPRCGLEADYIPGGAPVLRVAGVRPVPEGVSGRCGITTGYDPQSGPIYCGGRASLMADPVPPNGTMKAFACPAHEANLRRMSV